MTNLALIVFLYYTAVWALVSTLIIHVTRHLSFSSLALGWLLVRWIWSSVGSYSMAPFILSCIFLPLLASLSFCLWRPWYLPLYFVHFLLLILRTHHSQCFLLFTVSYTSQSGYGLATMFSEGVLVRYIVPYLGEINSMRLGLLAFSGEGSSIFFAIDTLCCHFHCHRHHQRRPIPSSPSPIFCVQLHCNVSLP